MPQKLRDEYIIFEAKMGHDARRERGISYQIVCGFMHTSHKVRRSWYG